MQQIALVRQQLLAYHLPLEALRNLRLSLNNTFGEDVYADKFKSDSGLAVDDLCEHTITEQVIEGFHDVVARVVRCSLEELGDDEHLVEQHLEMVGLPAVDTFRDRGSLNLQRLVAVTVQGNSRWAFHSVCVAAATVLMGTARSWWAESEMWDPMTVRDLVTELVDEMYGWAERPQTLQVWADPAGSRPRNPVSDLFRREWVIAEAGCDLEHLYWEFLVPNKNE